MRNHTTINTIEHLCNIAELAGIIIVLGLAFLFQVIYNELPCPLCLLQRVGFFFIAIGLLMNLRFGLRPSHYAFVILGSVFTAFTALRQIVLHIVPGTGSYGSPFLGYHLYTWSFILAMLILIATTVMMSIDRQYTSYQSKNKHIYWLVHTLFAITAVLISVNIATVALECGLGVCPDNPLTYVIPKSL